MNPIAFLKAAYAVAWVVYLGYLARILLRMRRVEEEIKDFTTEAQRHREGVGR